MCAIFVAESRRTYAQLCIFFNGDRFLQNCSFIIIVLLLFALMFLEMVLLVTFAAVVLLILYVDIFFCFTRLALPFFRQFLEGPHYMR